MVQLDIDGAGVVDLETVRQSIVNQLDKGNVAVVDYAKCVSTHSITGKPEVIAKESKG
ncbi:hypothetical protein [Priestia megaterium]